ncbi:hypothetical protein CW304_29815 [Bacillus sp. UFRGS-B20]|nr:hypothetical protein CW304_29815 [Bacillus sp. UFRGS-B20]
MPKVFYLGLKSSRLFLMPIEIRVFFIWRDTYISAPNASDEIRMFGHGIIQVKTTLGHIIQGIASDFKVSSKTYKPIIPSSCIQRT